MAAAYGVAAVPFPAFFAALGSTTATAARANSHVLALRESAPNREIRTPARLDHRYVAEDILYGLVPLAEPGARTGVPTPVAESLVTLTCTVNAIDYRAAGRRLSTLGLEHGGKDQVLHDLVTGAAGPYG